MRSEPLWLRPEDLVQLNAMIVAQTGEPFVLRDEGLLGSALARPQNRWAYEGEEDVLHLGAALLFAIARNHPFGQGNKRTAFEAFLIFLEMNGWAFVGEDDEALADLIVAVIARERDEAAFVDRIAPWVVPLGQAGPF